MEKSLEPNSEAIERRWQETDGLIRRIESSGCNGVNSHEILRLGDLYIELTSDLNKLKSSQNHVLRKRANALALRAYGIIHFRRTMGVMDMLRFFIFDFPALVRKRFHFVFAGALIFLMASLVGYLCINEKSRLLDLVISPFAQEQFRQNIARLDVNKPHPASREPGFGLSSMIMTNNIRVSILAFASGIFLGIGTVVILISNGLMLGGLAALYTDAGLSKYFWSLILPHGGIELICIFITAGAGLIIGYALINPGSFRRREWLIKEGHDAVKLVIGCVPLLIIAGLIEAYVTPAYLTADFKLIISGGFFLLIMAYLKFFGNSQTD